MKVAELTSLVTPSDGDVVIAPVITTSENENVPVSPNESLVVPTSAYVPGARYFDVVMRPPLESEIPVIGLVSTKVTAP